MMIKNLSFVAFLLAASITALLPAQGRGRRWAPPPPALLAVDINGDGELSADELDDARRSLLTLDKNGDGNLTSDELVPEEPAGGGRSPRGGPGRPGGPPGMGGMMGDHPVMKALDKDGDGELFEDEVTQAARSLDVLDVNGDDIVSVSELSTRRSGRFGRGPREAIDGYETTPKPSDLRPEMVLLSFGT